MEVLLEDEWRAHKERLLADYSSFKAPLWDYIDYVLVIVH